MIANLFWNITRLFPSPVIAQKQDPDLALAYEDMERLERRIQTLEREHDLIALRLKGLHDD